MFKNFSKMKIGLKIVIGILFVEFISLGSGIAMGRNITSYWVFLVFLATVAVSQFIAWLVSENVKKSVNTVLVELSETSTNLGSLSTDLTTAGHTLAEGSIEQAASIQETSSTLEESSSMIHQTTQNTKEAEILARQTKEFADKGNAEMKVMLSAMEELKRSSGEISKIIKVIDEIAFQTNILSLNAAVEAARAGDAGKGFAVVAEEVRNLAHRSAQAAQDTAVIIDGNIALSEKCLDITEQVDASLLEIVQDTHKVSELLEEISSASQEQEIGIGQINKAISQMEHVLHANATTAQESANSAEQLGGYSVTLKGIMSGLNYLINGGAQRQAAPKAPAVTKVKPTQTAKPIQPAKKPAPQPAKPAQPKAALKPAQPPKPAQPVPPKTTARPAPSVKPAQPLKPLQTAKPVQPLKPTQPKAALKPTQPPKPAQPKPTAQPTPPPTPAPLVRPPSKFGKPSNKGVSPEDIIPLDDF